MKSVLDHLYRSGTQLALVMPNTQPPVCTAEQAREYRQQLTEVEPRVLYLMTLYLNPQLTVEELRKAHLESGVIGVKYYPHGLTTNSRHGLSATDGFRSVYHLLEAMQSLGMVLNLHGEVQSNDRDNICIMNAEVHFLQQLQQLHADFPRLKIVLEHCTTAEAVQCVKDLGDTVAATITVHHLDLIVDDWAGRPHHYCKPVAKYPRDRQALRQVILDNNPKFFLGSDSAPHYRHRKEAAECCAGVYTSAYLVPVLAEVLEKFGAPLDKHLENFIFHNGYRFYKQLIDVAAKAQPEFFRSRSIINADQDIRSVLLSDKITLENKAEKIPEYLTVIESDGNQVQLVPFKAGQQISWSINHQ